MGYLGHEPLLYRDLTPRENLRFHARLRELPGERVEELLEAVGMTRRADDPVRELSRGMVQRVAVARALLHDPSCCCSTSRTRGSTPRPRALLEPLIGRASGRTRVLVTHDVDAGLAESDLALGLRGGRAAFAGEASAQQVEGALRVIRSAVAILRKDLLLELRTRESVPAMALFSLTVFVLFHFGLDRDSLDGELAAGVLWVTLLLAAVLGVNRLFAAEREQGGARRHAARADRPHRGVGGQGRARCSSTSSLVELVAVPAFAVLLLGPSPADAAARAGAAPAAGERRRRRRGRARRGAGGRGPRRASCSPRCCCCRCSCPWSSPGRRATAPLLAERGASGGPRALGWDCSPSTIWCSCSSP